MWCGDDKAGPDWDEARVDYLANLEGEGGLQPVVDALNAWHKVRFCSPFQPPRLAANSSSPHRTNARASPA
jgi:hypothetical protein